LRGDIRIYCAFTYENTTSLSSVFCLFPDVVHLWQLLVSSAARQRHLEQSLRMFAEVLQQPAKKLRLGRAAVATEGQTFLRLSANSFTSQLIPRGSPPSSRERRSSSSAITTSEDVRRVVDSRSIHSGISQNRSQVFLRFCFA
jgi:hypothetical protein